MATALDMIKRSMRLIRVLGKDQQLTSEESADALAVLNTMLDAWSIERLMVYQIQQITYSWPAGQQSRTIGTAGQFATAWPISIESAFVTYQSQDYPLIICNNRTEYDALISKTVQSTIPEIFMFDQAYPTGNMYLYSVPSENVTLKLNTWKPLQSFTSLTTDLSLPPGYQMAIETNLPIYLAPEYGKEVSPSVMMMANKAKAAIKSVNVPTLVSQLDSGLSSRQHARNIELG
jgi:hypothetical protein